MSPWHTSVAAGLERNSGAGRSAGPRRHPWEQGISGVALLAALTAGLALGGPAWADGGNGSGPGAGQGGIDGALASAAGGNAANGQATGGGGGGVDLTTGNGAPGGSGGSASTFGSPNGVPGATGAAGQVISTSGTISSSVSGGTGGTGQAGVNGVVRGGGGGGGGAGVGATADIVVTGSGSVAGGNGGIAGANSNAGGGGGGVGVFSSANVTIQAGGSATGGAGGRGLSVAAGGGGGAAAIVLTGGGTIANSGTLVGGAGGRSIIAGGGDGGAGVLLLSGGAVVNGTGATIIGGNGGQGGSAAAGGDGGAGIKGANIAVINGGAISGGAVGAGGGAPIAGKAIEFTGGVNSLEIWSTSNIAGNVQAFSAADTFKLGGATDASFALSQLGAGAKYDGFGLYEKAGTSTWTLTGTTAAVTPWTLTQGILSVSSDASLGASSGAVTFNGGTLQFGSGLSSARAMTINATGGALDTQANTDTLSGVISGLGGMTKMGTGVLVLTGANTYTGGTTISAGTLQLGGGGTAGSIAGDVADGGALAFDRSDIVTFGGTISGAGQVQQIGAGVTTLTGINTYAGGATISAGTLQGSATSFGSGSIQDNAALVIDQPANAAFANTINGSGNFTKQGAGQLNYTGTGGLTGRTTVAAGSLSVNGSLAGSATTVLSGATLGGNGTVGATTIQGGGTIAPGNSIGTLHVNGDFVQAAGSTYQVQLDPNSQAADLISVSGAATLSPGAGLSASKIAPGDYQPGATYTVLAAAGGRTGTYALSQSPSSVSAFLGLQDTYDANHVYLTVVQTVDPASAAQTPNQGGVGGAVDQMPITDPVRTSVLNLPSNGAARGAFDQLSGDALASAKGMLVSGGLLIRDVTFDHLREVFCSAAGNATEAGRRPSPACAEGADRPAAWVQGFGGWGHVDGNANAAGISQTTGGVLMGIDAPVQAWRVGAFGGYSRTGYDVNGRQSSGDSDNYHLGAYAGRQWGGLGLRLGASYTWNDLSTERRVAFGNFDDHLWGSYKASSTQVFGELGQRLAAGRFDVEPFVGAAYVSVQTGGFRETGGPAALITRGDTTEDAFTTLGLRPSTAVQIGPVGAVLRGMAGWRHVFGEVAPTSTASFAGGTPFTVSGAPLTRDTGVVEVGVDFAVIGGARAGLTYGGQVGGHETDNSLRASFTARF